MITIPIVLFLIVLPSQFVTSTAQPFLYEFNCTEPRNFTQNSAYQSNLDILLSNLTLQALKSGFHNSSYGQAPDQVHALYLCRGDVNTDSCIGCVDNAKDTLLKKCPHQKAAMIWYDECMFRYSNQPFFGNMDSNPFSYWWDPQNITANQTGFAEVLGIMMNHLIAEAAQSGKKFATKRASVTSSQTLYALGQCTPDLSITECDSCLGIASRLLPVVYRVGARVFQPSCNLRYDMNPFYMVATTGPSGKSGERRKPLRYLPIAVAVPTSAAILLILIGTWICLQRRKAFETTNWDIEDIKAVESLQYELATIRAATRNFSLENKLGQGGFGEVYKGKLGSGQEIAIKRLSENSGQGITEFKTEVALVAKLQHKNLVKLLGFCAASKEKILVYELLPNSSLDRFLFDPTKSISLEWETRFKIILGVARGLLYLHEDSRLKVIHRDLKSSNILLDEMMNPKISDFGLAKLFGVDETQGDTKRIVGTYGYMAPEYAITGHFSVKSDIFSFGVIILEIVSGKKNRFFGRAQVQEALLHRAWRLWNEKKVLDLVDPGLDSKYKTDEVTKCIQIGLLCIQEDADERPRITSVVAALNGESISLLPKPKAPHFFGNTSTSTEASSTNRDSQAAGNEVEQLNASDPAHASSDTYTGTDNITELYPR